MNVNGYFDTGPHFSYIQNRYVYDNYPHGNLMGRKKVSNPKQAKTISLSEQIWREIDYHGKNRSKTIQMSLEAYFDWSEYDIRDKCASQIAGFLHTRLGNNIGYDNQITKEIERLVKALKEFDF